MMVEGNDEEYHTNAIYWNVWLKLAVKFGLLVMLLALLASNGIDGLSLLFGVGEEMWFGL